MRGCLSLLTVPGFHQFKRAVRRHSQQCSSIISHKKDNNNSITWSLGHGHIWRKEGQGNFSTEAHHPGARCIQKCNLDTSFFMWPANKHLRNLNLSRTHSDNQVSGRWFSLLLIARLWKLHLPLHNYSRQSAPTDQSNKENCRFEALIKSIRHYLIKENLYSSTYSEIEGIHSFGVLQIICPVEAFTPFTLEEGHSREKTVTPFSFPFCPSSSKFQYGGGGWAVEEESHLW